MLKKVVFFILFISLIFSCSKKELTEHDAKKTVYGFITCFLTADCKKAEKFVTYPFWEDRLVYDVDNEWNEFCHYMTSTFRNINRKSNLSIQKILPLNKLYTLDEWESLDRKVCKDEFYEFLIDNSIITKDVYFAEFIYPKEVIGILIEMNDNVDIPKREKQLVVILHKKQNEFKILGIND